MRNTVIRVGVVFAVLFALGGWVAVGQALHIFGEVFKTFLPLFLYVFKSSVEDYLTSPYFIVGVIMAIASGFGIWIGAKT